MLLKRQYKAILERLLQQATYVPLYWIAYLKTQEWSV